MDCLFCKIAAGEIPSVKVYEDEDILAFKDIAPMAPVHIVIIPKKHIASSALDINAENSSVIARIFEKIPEIAEKCGIDKSGFRIANNCGDDGCQSIKHIHFHLLGGEKLSEKMC
jgi:histidine triad (HIT) family protein